MLENSALIYFIVIIAIISIINIIFAFLKYKKRKKIINSLYYFIYSNKYYGAVVHRNSLIFSFEKLKLYIHTSGDNNDIDFYPFQVENCINSFAKVCVERKQYLYVYVEFYDFDINSLTLTNKESKRIIDLLTVKLTGLSFKKICENYVETKKQKLDEFIKKYNKNKK